MCPWDQFPDQYILVMIFPCVKSFELNSKQRVFTEVKMGDKKRICKHTAIESFPASFFCVDERTWMQEY